MHPLLAALFSAWEWRPDVTAGLLVMGTLYGVGWVRLRRRSRYQILAQRRKLAFYLSGLATLAIALISPVDRLGGQLFFMHMIQHKLEIMVAAPLLCLADPFPFLLWGLPAGLRGRMAGWFARQAQPRRFLRAATGAGLAWFIFITFYMGWHDPGLYDLALRHPWVHNLQHITFFVSAMLFWWHVTAAAPHLHGRSSVWGRLAMLIAVIPAQMVAGITIATAPEVIYGYYATIPRFWGFSVLDDQAIGGMIMWTLSSEMIVWAAVFLLGGLFGGERRAAASLADAEQAKALGVAGPVEPQPQHHWRKLAERRLQARNAL